MHRIQDSVRWPKSVGSLVCGILVIIFFVGIILLLWKWPFVRQPDWTDGVPPSIEISIALSGERYSDQTIHVRPGDSVVPIIKAVDNLDNAPKIYLQIDGNEKFYQSGEEITVPHRGMITIGARAIDYEGNVGYARPVILISDPNETIEAKGDIIDQHITRSSGNIVEIVLIAVVSSQSFDMDDIDPKTVQAHPVNERGAWLEGEGKDVLTLDEIVRVDSQKFRLHLRGRYGESVISENPAGYRISGVGRHGETQFTFYANLFLADHDR